MVDVSLLQSASYVAAAIGVCVAAFYYVLTLRVQQENLREATKNRQATLSMNIMQSFLSEEGALRLIDLMNMQWSDFEDFKKKYDSSVNPGSFAKRQAVWNTCEVIGYQYRSGLLDINTIYSVGGYWIRSEWRRFKSVIEEYRKWEAPRDYLENFEYLADVLQRMAEERDPEDNKKGEVLRSTHARQSVQ
jgi:hypothetical protein